MRNLLAGAMTVSMALCLFAATIAFGGVTPDLAAPAYGLAGILAVLWAAKLLFAEVVSWKNSPLHVWVLVFMLYAVARYFTSPIEYDSRVELLQVLACGFIYFAAAFNFYRSRDRSFLLATLIILAVLQAGYALWQFSTGAETVLRVGRPENYYHRGGGTFICPNHLAGFLEMVLGLVLGSIVWRRVSRTSVERSALQKVALIYAAFMVLGGLVVTFSRAGWFTAGIGVLLFLIVLLWGDWRSRVMWPRIATAVICVVALGVLASRLQPARDYLSLTFWPKGDSEATGLKDPSMGGRTYLWLATGKLIRDHPLVGTGPGTWQWFHLQYRSPRIWTHPEYAHNDILNAASDYGLIGFGILLAALVSYYRHAALLTRTAASSEQRSFALGGILALTMILVHSWFDFNLHIPANGMVLALILGLTVAMDDEAKRHPRLPMPKWARRALGGLLLAMIFGGAWIVGRTGLASRYTSKGVDAKLGFSYEEAIEKFNRAIVLDPRFPVPYNRLADIYGTQAEFRVGRQRAEGRQALARQTIDACQKSLALNPYQSWVHLRLARALEVTGQYDEALEVYHTTLEKDPNNAFSLARLGFHHLLRSKQMLASDIADPAALAARLKRQSDEVSKYLWDRFSEPTRRLLTAHDQPEANPETLRAVLAEELTRIIQDGSIYEEARFAGVELSEATQALLKQDPEEEPPLRLNRWLLEDAYREELAQIREKAAAAFERSWNINSATDRVAFVNFKELRGLP